MVELSMQSLVCPLESIGEEISYLWLTILGFSYVGIAIVHIGELGNLLMRLSHKGQRSRVDELRIVGLYKSPLALKLGL